MSVRTVTDDHLTSGMWAVCSGSIDAADPSPEAAAKREILEETTLSDADIGILRRGKPFSLADEALQTEWTIHPFAWQLKDNAKPIKFDWEHTQYKFIKPEDLQNYNHVPQLEIGMERVLVSPETEDALFILENDHESGAQALAVKALELLQKAVRGKELSGMETCEDLWKELRWRAWHLAKNGRPSMGAAIEAEIIKTLDIVSKEMISRQSEGTGGISLANLRNITESAISARILAIRHSLDNLALYFVNFIESKSTSAAGNRLEDTNIVTLSSSGTTTQSLSKFITSATKNGTNVKITVLESRPEFEGVTFVNNLLASFKDYTHITSRLKVEIVSDASVAVALHDAHYLLFGGDKVLPNGNVSNKIGTVAATVLAKSLNPACQIIALFATSKITDSGFDSEHLAIEYNDPVELTRAWPSNYIEQLEERQGQGYQVEVKNAYFEWVQAKYIDQHISELGLLSREEILRLGTESKELERKIFGDL